GPQQHDEEQRHTHHDDRVQERAVETRIDPRVDVVVEVPLLGERERRGEDLFTGLEGADHGPQHRTDDQDAPDDQHDVGHPPHGLVLFGGVVLAGRDIGCSHSAPPSSLPPARRFTVNTTAAKSSVSTAITTPMALAYPARPSPKAELNNCCVIDQVARSGPPLGFRADRYTNRSNDRMPM